MNAEEARETADAVREQLAADEASKKAAELETTLSAIRGLASMGELMGSFNLKPATVTALSDLNYTVIENEGASLFTHTVTW